MPDALGPSGKSLSNRAKPHLFDRGQKTIQMRVPTLGSRERKPSRTEASAYHSPPERLKHEAGLDYTAWLGAIQTARTESVAGHKAARLNKRELSTHEKAAVLIGGR